MSGKFDQFLSLMKAEIEVILPTILYSLFPFPIRTGKQKQAIIKKLADQKLFQLLVTKNISSLVWGKCHHQLLLNLAPLPPPHG